MSMSPASGSVAPQIPVIGFLRLKQIIGDPKKGVVPIIPVSRSTWLAGVKTGRFPAPVHFPPRTTAWRAEDIRAWIEKTSRAK